MQSILFTAKRTIGPIYWFQHPKYTSNSSSSTSDKKKKVKKWAEEINIHFSKKSHADGQQTHEKMFNITNY